VGAGDEHQHVARDHLLRVETVGADRVGLGQGLPEGGCICVAAGRAQVRQAVVPAIVAKNGGVDRISFEDPLPESIGQFVDCVVGVGHGCVVS
jgi:hypothetical protein